MALTRKPNYDTILRVVIGSHANGYASEESDRDEQGVCIESLEDFVGFREFEQDVVRTSEIREGMQNAPSQAGDLDLKIYSLRKFLRLALAGNPDVLAMLFNKNYVYSNALGNQLQEMYPLIVSKEAGKKYLGYAHGQRQRLLGERGGKDVNRHKLVEKYGWDVKYGTHIVRLGYQGIELLKTGKITLPMPAEELAYCKRVRAGELSQEEVLARGTELESQLQELLTTSTLQERPNVEAVESWMIETYYQWWRAKRVLKDRMGYRISKDGDLEVVWSTEKSVMKLSEPSPSTPPTKNVSDGPSFIC